MVRGMSRVLGASVVLVLGLCGCAAAPDQAPASTGDEPARALIGSWSVATPGELEASAAVSFAEGWLEVTADCGSAMGAWRAAGSTFLADPNLADTCQVAHGHGSTPQDFGWLFAAAELRVQNDTVALLDSDGTLVATLSPAEGDVDAVGGGAASIVDAVVLPSSARPISDITGRWLPTDGSGTGAAFIEFGAGGFYEASDGCNGIAGRWALGDDSAFLGTRGLSSQVFCDNWEGATWLPSASRVGTVDGELAFFDADGALLGTMSRA